MSLGPMEIAIIAIVIFALFGYKKLPDASRAVGRSLRIFKGEMKGMKDDDVETKAEAQTTRSAVPPVINHPAPSAYTPPTQQAYAPQPTQPAQQAYAPQPAQPVYVPPTQAQPPVSPQQQSDPTAPPSSSTV